MPGRDNSYEALARAAVQRMEGRRDLAEQLTLLPDEQDLPVDPDTPKRGKGKALNQMREFMAAKGFRMPEEVLIQLAGLDSGLDVFELAMRRTEDQLAWAFADTTVTKNGQQVKLEPSPTQRLRTFENNVAVILRSNDALMPYGTPKATPDGGNQTVVQVTVASPAGSAQQAPDMRDVTPKVASRMVPADVAHERQQNQQLSDSQSEPSDCESRTE